MHARMTMLLSCRVGFNSVYHVTDLPGFVSGEHLVFFDPHCKYLPSISAANPGKKINFLAHPVNSKLADQVAPFHIFGCNTRQAFSGTLFRFPLRTQQQADASTISKQVGQQCQMGIKASNVEHGGCVLTALWCWPPVTYTLIITLTEQWTFGMLCWCSLSRPCSSVVVSAVHVWFLLHCACAGVHPSIDLITFLGPEAGGSPCAAVPQERV